MDFSKPTALEAKWRDREKAANELCARMETRFGAVLAAIKSDAPLEELGNALRLLSIPMGDLHSEYNDRIPPLFGRAVQRIIAEAEVAKQRGADSGGTIQGQLDAFTAKLARLVEYFETQTEKRSVQLASPDRVEAYTHLISSPDGEKYLPTLMRARFDPKISKELLDRDRAAIGGLVDPICANELLVDSITAGRVERVMNPESRLQILKTLVGYVTTAYRVPVPEIHAVPSAEMTPKGIYTALLPMPYEIIADLNFAMKDREQLGPYTFISGLRLGRHAVQCYLAKSEAFQRGIEVEEPYRTPLALAREFGGDARAFGIAFHTRDPIKDVQPPSEVLFTTKLKCLLDTDAIVFAEAVQNKVLDKLEPE